VEVALFLFLALRKPTIPTPLSCCLLSWKREHRRSSFKTPGSFPPSALIGKCEVNKKQPEVGTAAQLGADMPVADGARTTLRACLRVDGGTANSIVCFRLIVHCLGNHRIYKVIIVFTKNCVGSLRSRT